jgi:glycosyltransferase involved in cell wall biosynthesis
MPPSRVVPETPSDRTTGRQIRVAYLLGRLKSGGAELQMIALARGLTQQGFRVDFVCRSGVGPLDERARATGATIRHIGERSAPDMPAGTRFGRRVTKHLGWVTTARRERYDVVDAWLHPTDIFASLSRPLTGIPVVVAGRRDRLPRLSLGPATGTLNRAVNRLTDVVVANAEVTAADVVRDQGVTPRRVRVIRAGVEIPRPYSAIERQAQRAALGANEDDFVIGCVGNLRTMKRQDLIIEAFALLLPEHDRLRLVLVGDGEMRPRIEHQIAALGLERRIVLTGIASDLPPLYDAFDLFVQASNSESLPNVLLEASAAALPIVATAAGGSSEVVHDGTTGLLVPVDDLGALTRAMHRAISDADLRRTMASEARELVIRDYGMDRFVRAYADLYREQLMARRAR